MVKKCLFLRIVLAVFCLLTISISYAQNPDGKLTFNVTDKSGSIQFDTLKHTYNKDLVIDDLSGIYSIEIRGLNPDNTPSNTNLKIDNIEGISHFMLSMGWSYQVSIGIKKRIKNKIEIMNILFENVYQLSVVTQIQFKKGNHRIDVKEFFESKAINKSSLDKNIDQEYFKKIKKAQAAAYEIHLKKVINNAIKTGYDYQFTNQKDTAFTVIKHHGDFGIVDYSYFVVKDKLPDGAYKIYVDHELRKELFYKNGLKVGSWKDYRDNGEKAIATFSKGQIKGNVFEYFNDGSIKSKSYFTSKGIKWRISYSDSDVVKLKEYFKENKQYKIEKFDATGKLIETKLIGN